MKFSRIDPSQARPTTSPQHFQGNVRMQELVGASDSQEVTLTAVFFADGARTLPHVHDTDQVLAVVDGTCFVAQRDQRRTLQPGEYAFIPAGEWHWHGAAPGNSACHISIRKAGQTRWDVPRHDYDEHSGPAVPQQ